MTTFPKSETLRYPVTYDAKFTTPEEATITRKHQNTRLWNAPADITRERARAVSAFIPTVGKVTNAAGKQMVKEAPAAVIGRDSLSVRL